MMRTEEDALPTELSTDDLHLHSSTLQAQDDAEPESAYNQAD